MSSKMNSILLLIILLSFSGCETLSNLPPVHPIGSEPAAASQNSANTTFDPWSALVRVDAWFQKNAW